MNNGKLIFAQLMEHVPSWQLQACVRRYHGDRYVKTFSCRDQFLTMAFAQLTSRESLRDIEAFFGTSDNAVRTQFWVAISVYVLVALVKKRLNLAPSMLTILQVLELTVFEKMPLKGAFSRVVGNENNSIEIPCGCEQPDLFDS